MGTFVNKEVKEKYDELCQTFLNKKEDQVLLEAIMTNESVKNCHEYIRLDDYEHLIYELGEKDEEGFLIYHVLPENIGVSLMLLCSSPLREDLQEIGLTPFDLLHVHKIGNKPDGEILENPIERIELHKACQIKPSK